MRLFSTGKDGGYESTVWGFWLIEWKRFFSVVLLCFEDGSRDAYHNHAFNSISWVLRGRLTEHHLHNLAKRVVYTPSWRPVITRRTTFHKVVSQGRTWVLSFRGPWAKTWEEYRYQHTPGERYVTLTHGRRQIEAR